MNEMDAFALFNRLTQAVMTGCPAVTGVLLSNSHHDDVSDPDEDYSFETECFHSAYLARENSFDDRQLDHIPEARELERRAKEILSGIGYMNHQDSCAQEEIELEADSDGVRAIIRHFMSRDEVWREIHYHPETTDMPIRRFLAFMHYPMDSLSGHEQFSVLGATTKKDLLEHPLTGKAIATKISMQQCSFVPTLFKKLDDEQKVLVDFNNDGSVRFDIEVPAEIWTATEEELL